MNETIGVYGKVSTQGDFLRVGAGEFSRAGLDRWLDEAVGVLATERTVLDVPAAFLLSPPQSELSFLGALAPSEDAVGRKFPLLIFAELPSGAVAGALPVVPTQFAPFVRSTGELLREAPSLSGVDLAARANALPFGACPPLHGDEVATLSNEPALPLLTALAASPPALAYALRTFGLACDQALKTGTTTTITVDAPAPSPAARELWLEIARRRFRGRGAPTPSTLLWTDGPTGRLLITFGPPTPTALTFLANPRHRSPRLWPLRTDVTSALTQALQSLTPEQRQTVSDPRVSMAQLVAAFS